MSTPDGASTNKPTERQEQVLNYLKSHRINEELNVMINRVCKEMSEDPFGHLAREALARAKAPSITRLVGREILDSRGNPTVETDVYALVGGKEKLVGRSGAPSGASTGSNEAFELRDEEKDRYLGKGTKKAAENVSTKLSAAVKGWDPRKLRELDELLIKTDGSNNKSNIGGNAITATSFALAEAGAALAEKQLFLFFAEFFHGADKTPNKYSLPRPMVNILNGGKHAGGELKIQEFMIVPKIQKSFRENLRIVTEVYHHLGKLLVKKKGLSAKNLGDEGGYAPDLRDPHETLSLIEEAITLAHYKVGEDVFLALDCAASEFYDEGKYEIEKGKFFTSAEALQYYLKLKKDHPALISIEDPLDEKDYDGWQALTAAFAKEYGKDVMIIGDDLYTTNPTLIRQGVEKKWANSLLLKVNQIGTISESMDAAHLIFNDHGNVAVSHRSGETPSSIIADLAVGIGAGFIKTGATARGERIAKYNRLLQIEEYLIENDLLA